MTATVAQIAAALRHERPELTPGRIHKLLYLCQGHHLAWFGQPLFRETVSAWDSGPVVAVLWHAERQTRPGPAGLGDLGDRELNTVGRIISRYGNLTVRDLEILTRAGAPVRAADAGREPGTSVVIDHAAMTEHFKTLDVDPDEPAIDADFLAGFLARSAAQRDKPAKPDDLDRLLATYGRRDTQVAGSGSA